MTKLATVRRTRPTPLEDLEREHSLVRRALEVLERIAGHVEADLPFPADDVVVLLRFFREFVEGVHHRKETEVLYPAAVMVGGDACAECAGLLVRSHEDTRALLHSLILFWEPEGGLLEVERRGFVVTCRAYAMRLLRHMETEEEQLFRTIRQGMPPDDQMVMAMEFARMDRAGAAGRKWLAAVQELERYWRA